MSINYKHINTLTKIAESNDGMRAKLAAAVVRGNYIISIGMNSMKTHPFQAKYGINSECIYMHAELAAIKNALREIDVTDFRYHNMYIVRVKRPFPNSNSFIYGLAKPCIGCMRAITEFGLNKIVFTTNLQGKINVI